MIISEKQRDNIVASYVNGGTDPVTARIVCDLAAQAAERALKTFNQATKLGRTGPEKLMIESLGLQLLANEAMLHAMAHFKVAQEFDIPMNWAFPDA